MKKKIFTLLSALGLTLSMFSSTVFAGDATREECVAKVQEAVKMAVEQGEAAALEQVGNAAGSFVWKDSYVFATTATDALTLAHPIKPKLVGRDLLHVKDVNGVLIFAEIARIASSATGQGWVDYMWPKPGEKKPSSKHTYVEKVPGMNVAMGAGYYE